MLRVELGTFMESDSASCAIGSSEAITEKCDRSRKRKGNLSTFHPSSAFHLSAGQGAKRNQPDRHPQRKGAFKTAFQFPNQARYVRAIGAGFDLQAQFGHRPRGADVHLVFGHLAAPAHNLLNRARINIDPPHHHHLIGTPQNTASSAKSYLPHAQAPWSLVLGASPFTRSPVR